MLIVQPISTEQQVTFYVRKHTAPGEAYNVFIRNEETQKDTSLLADGTYNGKELELAITYTFIEGRFFTIRTYHPITGDLLNFSKIYATAQTDLEKYSVLNGYYTEIQKTDQDFIVKP